MWANVKISSNRYSGDVLARDVKGSSKFPQPHILAKALRFALYLCQQIVSLPSLRPCQNGLTTVHALCSQSLFGGLKLHGVVGSHINRAPSSSRSNPFPRLRHIWLAIISRLVLIMSSSQPRSARPASIRTLSGGCSSQASHRAHGPLTVIIHPQGPGPIVSLISCFAM